MTGADAQKATAERVVEQAFGASVELPARKWRALEDAITAALKAEREECAKVAEEAELMWDIEWLLNATKKDCSARACTEIAAAIRGRP